MNEKKLPFFIFFMVSAAFSLFAQTEGDFEVLQKADNTIMITGCRGNLSAITIPSTIYGQLVNEIGSNAFSGNTVVRSLIIPASVTLIGNSAFAGNTNLTNVSLGSGVESIGDSAFSGCSLPLLALPATLRSIGNAAFAGNNLRDILIPDSVVRIGVGAFEENPQLSRIILGTGLENVYFNAFGSGRDSIEFIAVGKSGLDLGGIGLDQNFVNVYNNGGSAVYARRGNAWVKEAAPFNTFRAAYQAELASKLPREAAPVAPPPVSAPPASGATAQTQTRTPVQTNTPAKTEEDPLGKTWTIYFAPNGAAFTGLGQGLLSANQEAMAAVAAILKKYPSYKARITGFANPVRPTAREERNLLVPLSLKRAEAAAALLNFLGISSKRIVLRGGGSSSPIASYRNQANWYKNRRAEIRIVK
jgi:outer membrane protein OmpA-like peptidoglycan-associated protein